MAERVAAPSREQFRERRRLRRLERRRAWVGLPLVLAGLGLIGTGVYVWVQNNSDPALDPGVRVGGEVQVRTTTTVPATTTTGVLVPVELAPAVSIVAPADTSVEPATAPAGAAAPATTTTTVP